MKNRSVVKLLTSLGQRNINSLDSYLHSFYGNQECVLLFDTIKEYAPKFSSKKMQEELVWKRCFPSKKMTTNRIDKLCSTLQGHVKEFMAWQEMKDDAVLREKLFLKAISRYELKEDFEDTLERLVSLIKEEKNTEIWTREALIEVYHQQYFSVNLTPKKDKGKKEYINIIENLDAFYLTYRTLLETEKRSREYVLSEELQDFNFKEIQSTLKKIQSNNQSSLLQTLELFLKDEIIKDTAFYDVLEKRVFNLLPELHIKDQETILNILTLVANYYSKQGKEGFVPRMFKILRYGVESGASIKNNSMSYVFFLNIIDMGCTSEQVEWVESFFHNYQSYLPTDIRAETVRLSKGIIAFGKQEFQEAKKILEVKRFADNRQNILSRWILPKVYYELQDDKLTEECNALYQFTYRDKLYNESGRKANLNFIKAIELLNNPNVRKDEIVAFIENCEVVSQSVWVKQKVRERKS